MLKYDSLMTFRNKVNDKVSLAYKVDWKRSSDPTSDALRYFKNILMECCKIVTPEFFFKITDDLMKEIGYHHQSKVTQA